MAHIWRDFVLETTTTTGTGNLSLAGAVTGYRAFSAVCTTNDTVYYFIQAIDGSGIPSGEWETGLGTYSASNTLTRTTVIASSNSGSAVNLSSGTKRVALCSPAIIDDYRFRTVDAQYADAGNSGTSETDIYSYTSAAGLLAANGDRLEAQYAGTFVSSGTATRQLKVKFAGTTIFDTGALSVSTAASWDIFVTVIRVSSTVVRYVVSLTTQGAALAAYTGAGELTGLTLSNTNILKLTGTAAGVGAATNDIVGKLTSVDYKPKGS